MSICFNYLSVPSAIIKRCREDVPFLSALCSGEDEARSRLPKGCKLIGVDKAWDGIWYLISAERRATDDLYGPRDLLGQAIDGAAVLNANTGEDGYGCPRFLPSAQVKKAAKALKEIKLATIRANFDPRAMKTADVYPGNWGRIGLDYALDQFKKLRAFYAKAAEAGHAVIVWGS